MFRTSCLGAIVLVAALTARTASADTFTYRETIEDTSNPTFILYDFGQDLSRTRVLGDGTVQFTGSDSTIKSENDADGFGLSSTDDITWTHIFIDLPPAQQFVSATVEIAAFGASGETVRVGGRRITINNDKVSVDGVELGALNAAGAFRTTTTLFDLGSAVDISVVLADGRLEVSVDPKGPGFLGLPVDAISIQKSVFEVTYKNFEETTPNTAFIIFGGGPSGTFGSGWINILNLGGLTTHNAPFPNLINNGPGPNLPGYSNPNLPFFFLGGGNFPGFSPHVMMGVETTSGGGFAPPPPIARTLQEMIVMGLATIGALSPTLESTGGYAEGISEDDLINHILSFDTTGTYTFADVQGALFDGGYTQFSDGAGQEVVFFFDPTNAGLIQLDYPQQGGPLSVTYTPQPEPGTLLLLGAALAGALVLRRKRQRR